MTGYWKSGYKAMQTEVLSARNPHNISYALEILISGGLVAFPTDTVYGLGALAFSKKSVESIYTAKGRSADKAIPIMVGEQDQLDKVATQVPEMAAKLAAAFWPGPLTLVVPKHPFLPEAVSATGTVGVRLPDHAAARDLLRLSGPLAVTSANLSGEASLSTAAEVLEQLGGRIALILDGGRTPGGQPSTVVSCVGPQPVILREGPITLEQIRRILAPNSRKIF
jgi:L-threonylcarbamoyladenylate synthase